MIIYGTYILLNNLYKSYEAFLLGKNLIYFANNRLGKNKIIYSIHDEIWEIIDKEELYIFNDCIHI